MKVKFICKSGFELDFETIKDAKKYVAMEGEYKKKKIDGKNVRVYQDK